MRCNIFTLFVLFTFILQKAAAQNTAYQFSHLDITNGLSINQVSSVYKDTNGFMWFGTASGLNRYDGYKFRVFKHEANNPNSLKDNFVTNILEGPGKKMWVKTHSGLSVYDPVTEKFSNDIVSELVKYDVLTDQLNAIRKDQQGNFWFLTNNNGLYCYHPRDNTTTFFSNAQSSKPVLHANTVTDVISDNQGMVWLVYNDGVIEKFDTRRETVVSRSSSLSKLNNRALLYSGVLDNCNDLWLYATGSATGVYRYHIKTDAIDHYSTETGDIRLNYNVINNIILGDDKKIWIGTDHGGINLIDPATNTIQYLLNREDDTKSLRGNCVVLYKDNIGIIWAGTFKQGIKLLPQKYHPIPARKALHFG